MIKMALQFSFCVLRYAKTLFLLNSSLSDARLCRIRVDPETRLCFADLSFRVDDRKISSYATHLKGGINTCIYTYIERIFFSSRLSIRSCFP